EVGRLTAGRTMIVNGRWSPDSTRLAGAATYRAWVWDVRTGKAFGPPPTGHDAPVTTLAFTSDGRLVTSAEDSTIRSWDPATGKELSRQRTDQLLRRLAVSPDGTLAAGSFEPSNVRVWDAKTGAEVFKLAWSTKRTGGVYRIRFSADEQSLLTYGSDYHL